MLSNAYFKSLGSSAMWRSLICLAALWDGAFGVGRLWAREDQPCGHCGQPLLLTPYLEEGRLEEARQLSRVPPWTGAPKVPSYSGFFTVNKTHGSNLFFWFFPAMNGDGGAPLVVWLQGGPGLSSLFGLFAENGPYRVEPDGARLSLRPWTWARRLQLLFVDNPVGTGFSFTQDEGGYPGEEAAVDEEGADLLRQFLVLFPEYERNDLYLAGESYAGKYVPSLAARLLGEPFRLRGIAVGNGLCDPVVVAEAYAPYLAQLGLVDAKQADSLASVADHVRAQVQAGRTMDALYYMTQLVMHMDAFHNGSATPSLFRRYSGLEFYYNFLEQKAPPEFDKWRGYVQNARFRQAVHVGNVSFNSGLATQRHLLADVMRPVGSAVARLLDAGVRALFYSGQLDVVVPHTATERFLHSLRWKGAADWKPRQLWCGPEGAVFGYVHQARNLAQVLVRNSGHMVPHDVPEAAFDLLHRFVGGQPYGALCPPEA